MQLKFGVVNTIKGILSYPMKPVKFALWEKRHRPHMWIGCSVTNEDVQMDSAQRERERERLSLGFLLLSPTQTGSDSCFQLLRIKGPIIKPG